MNIKNYFSFTRGEKRGVVVLLLIIVSLIIANLSVDFFKKNTATDFSEFEKDINQFEAEIDKRTKEEASPSTIQNLFNFNPNTISNQEWTALGFKKWQIKAINNYKAKGGKWKTKSAVAKIYGLDSAHFEQLKPYILLPEKVEKRKTIYPKKETLKIEYFEFNPNTISKEEWKRLGFKDWQIKTIFNYKAKGGNWKTKADVRKIYGLNDSDYNQLEPYILLPKEAAKKDPSKSKKEVTTKVDINTADAKELTQLKGIYSEKYAKIIIKHRNKLGGFTSKEQLKEVWNMTEETYSGFIHQVVLGKYEAPFININTSSVQQLKNHPYIDWKTANAIFKYRKANGKYNTIEDLQKIHLINKKTYLKIKPYLKVN